METSQRLLDAGMYVDRNGRVEFTRGMAEEYAASPWLCDLPQEGNALLIQRGVTAQDENAIGNLPRKLANIEAPVHSRSGRRHRSNSGATCSQPPGAGHEWLAVPMSCDEWWNDDQYYMAARLWLSCGVGRRPRAAWTLTYFLYVWMFMQKERLFSG